MRDQINNAAVISAEDNTYKMTFPNGAVVESRRNTMTARDGNILVDEEVETRGALSYTWLTGPSWMFELISINEGSIFFIRDGNRVEPPARRFGLLYSIFSIIEICFDNVKFHWTGFGGTDPFPEGWMNRPMLLDMKSDDKPSTTDELIELLRRGPSFQPIEKASSPSQLSQSVKSIIDQTYNADLSIANIARQLGVSHPHLTRQFKKDFGLTPIDYCHQVRAMDATNRLAKGEQIIDVSLDVGYNDLGRFYKQFRRTMNSSPGSCKTMLKMPNRAV